MWDYLVFIILTHLVRIIVETQLNPSISNSQIFHHQVLMLDTIYTIVLSDINMDRHECPNKQEGKAFSSEWWYCLISSSLLEFIFLGKPSFFRPIVPNSPHSWHLPTCSRSSSPLVTSRTHISDIYIVFLAHNKTLSLKSSRTLGNRKFWLETKETSFFCVTYLSCELKL